MSSDVPLLTWDHGQQIAARIVEITQRHPVDALTLDRPNLLGYPFAALSDKCFNVTSLLMAITGRTSRFPMTVRDYLEGEFETEAGFALAQLPLQLHNLCVHCAHDDNEYDAEFGSALSLLHRLGALPPPSTPSSEAPGERIETLRGLVRLLPLADLPRPFGAAEAVVFRRCWLEPIASWPYGKLTPPPEPLLAKLVSEVLVLGNLAFQFWAGLSHFTWGGSPTVFDGSEHELSAAYQRLPESEQLALLLKLFLQIAAYDLPAPDNGHRFSTQIDLVGQWHFGKYRAE